MGYKFNTHLAYLPAPCFPLEAPEFVNSASARQDLLTCKKIYKKVMRVIANNCPLVKEIQALDVVHQKRIKRFLPLLAAGVVGGVIS